MIQRSHDIQQTTSAARWRQFLPDAAEPILIHQADLLRPFVYWRRIGVVYVPAGCHQVVMASMNSRLDEPGGHELTVGELADEWLEHTEGAAFRSSVGSSIMAGARGNLNATERRLFERMGDLRYM